MKETWTNSGTAEDISRHEHTATLLPSGKVLVVGGFSFSTNPAVLYNP